MSKRSNSLLFARPFKLSLEKGTIAHKIAQQTLKSYGDDPQSPTGDYEIFRGSIAEKSLYDDMLAANAKLVRKEQQKRLAL